MTDILEQIRLVFTDMLHDIADRVYGLLPEVVLAAFVLVVGWIVSVVAHHLTVYFLEFFAIDKLAAKTPLDQMMKSVGIRSSVSDILARLVFWIAILIALLIAADILQLQQISIVLTTITGYVPQVIGTIIIVIVGMLLARFLQILSLQAMHRVDPTYKRTIAGIVQVVVLAFVFLAAVDQLGFQLDLAVQVLAVVVSAFLIMFGLGLAISARSVLDNAIACWQLKKQLSVGEEVVIDGQEGRVTGFTLTSVLLERATGTVVLPASTFFSLPYTRRASHES